jgi:ABC-type branched-subunit amino acid transport system ATPase component/ABC-type branched-subunit amino acid transport system permease subunit
MDIVRFALLGLATGSLYAMVTQGMVLVYRGSGLLNFAQAAFAMVGAYVDYELRVQARIPGLPSLLCAMLACAALGAAVHLGILRRMRNSSPLSRVIATVGVLMVLYAAAVIRYQLNTLPLPSVLPTSSVTVLPGVIIGEDRLLILLIGCALTAGLWLVYRFTSFGRATAAVAQSELHAATLGYSPDRIATINWAIGGALAALAGALIAPITYLVPDQLAITLLIFPLAAGLVGRFSSFPVCFVAALVIGIGQSELSRYSDITGIQSAAPFLVVIVALVAIGRGLPIRGTLQDRLPAVGTGRIRPVPVLVLYAVFAVLAFVLNVNWATALTVTICTAIICLSVVVVTGYAGQLSFAQYILAGVSALVAARLSAYMPFVAALIIAVLVNAAAGLVFGLPALRTRGITFAIVTFGLAVSISAVLLENYQWTGGSSGITVPTPSLFGWNIDPNLESGRYAFVCLSVLVLLACAVANLRRGVTGRRLLAVRSNERAAASLGVNVAWVKSYAFMLSAAIAGTGGVLLAFLQPDVLVSQFDVFTSITLLAVVVVGGLGSPGGALIGSLLVGGGIATQIFSGWDSFNSWLPLIGGISLLLNLRFAPDGLFELNRQMLAPLMTRADRLWARLPNPVRRRATAPAAPPVAQTGVKISPRVLQVRGLSVSFGGVHALTDVSLDLHPGEVHGLIGPNGAGKTTLIDAITGFVKTTAGSVQIGETPIAGWAAHRRARAGLSRSFQSLELFTDLTVQENVAVACQRSGRWPYFTDLVWPRRIRLTPAAREAMRQFELDDLRELKQDQISFGQRKVVAIARAIAGAPSVLLLDEPAAGLDDHEAAELAGLIIRLAQDWGIAVLLVEHKIDMVMSASDRVTVLVGGRVLTSGTPAEVSANPAVVDAYLGSALPVDAQGTDLVS